MKAKLSKTREPKQQTMADMQPWQLAIVTRGVYEGHIVARIDNGVDRFRIQSLPEKGQFWNMPNDNPVRILEPGEQVVLTQE